MQTTKFAFVVSLSVLGQIFRWML